MVEWKKKEDNTRKPKEETLFYFQSGQKLHQNLPQEA